MFLDVDFGDWTLTHPITAFIAAANRIKNEHFASLPGLKTTTEDNEFVLKNRGYMSVAVHIAFIFCFEFSNVGGGKESVFSAVVPCFGLKVAVSAQCLIQGCSEASKHQNINMKTRDWIHFSVVSV